MNFTLSGVVHNIVDFLAPIRHGHPFRTARRSAGFRQSLHLGGSHLLPASPEPVVCKADSG